MRFIFSAILLSLLIIGPQCYSQTFSVSSTAAFSNTNTVTDVTFNFQNTNSYPVKITSIEGVMAAAGSTTVSLWYRSTPLSASAPPGAISVANGWTQQVSTIVTAIANTSTTNTQPLFSNLALQIPAGATYAFAISAYISTSTSNQRCFAMTAPFLPLSTFTQSGCSILTGDNISFSGGVPPAVPSITSRGWIGKILFESAAACTNPPNPGTVSASVPSTCYNANFTLSIIGSSLGSGQTLQWQSSNDNISWTNITGGTTSPFTTSQTTSKYYKCIVTCGTSAETLRFIYPLIMPYLQELIL